MIFLLDWFASIHVYLGMYRCSLSWAWCPNSHFSSFVLFSLTRFNQTIDSFVFSFLFYLETFYNRFNRSDHWHSSSRWKFTDFVLFFPKEIRLFFWIISLFFFIDNKSPIFFLHFLIKNEFIWKQKTNVRISNQVSNIRFWLNFFK